MSRIAILGAGAWGTALALSLARQQRHQLTLWAHTPAHVNSMQRDRENKQFLPGFALPQDLKLTASLEEAAEQSDILLIVTPSEFVGATATALAPHLRAEHTFVNAAKGIEDRAFLRMSEVVAAITPTPFGALSGPSFAHEVAAALPTALTLATRDHALAQQLRRDFSSESLRIYTNDDLPGVELGGALKNVIALASGVVAGLELGHNASAALITRGMAEMTRLAVACGARAETMSGLAGYGDLVLTCTGALSRNRSVGIELGRGRKLPEIIASLNGKVAEGIRCTHAALGLAARHNIEMPITREMQAVLNEERTPQAAIRTLMTRPGRDE